MVLLFFLSTFSIVSGLYNYFAFGNCNGPQSSAFCVFKEIGSGIGRMSPNDINITDHPVRGNQSATKTLIEFACLQCPFSKAAESNVQQILKSYPDKVKLVYFFFPLSQHKNGFLAAKADYCAGEQGKFWEYHDLLFQNQSYFDNSVSDTDAKKFMINNAKQVGLDTTKFASCIDSDAAFNRVERDVELGRRLGLEGTPTFFIDGKKLVGPQTCQTFQELINK